MPETELLLQFLVVALDTPVLAVIAQRLGESVEPILRFANSVPIFDKHHIPRRVSEADARQGPLMRGGPESSTRVSMAVAQQQRLELLTGLEPRAQRILASARQITHGFVSLIRDDDRYEVA